MKNIFSLIRVSFDINVRSGGVINFRSASPSSPIIALENEIKQDSSEQTTALAVSRDKRDVFTPSSFVSHDISRHLPVGRNEECSSLLATT